MNIQKIRIEPTSVKSNGAFSISMDFLTKSIPFAVRDRNISSFPPGVLRGGHKHIRREAFMAFSPGLELIWINEKDEIVKEKMDSLVLFVIPSMVSHAIVNKSRHVVMAAEFADKPESREEITLIEKIRNL